MANNSNPFRFSLRSLIALTTFVALIAFYLGYFRYYHFTPKEVEVGTFHSLSHDLETGSRIHCNCRVFVTSHWPDILRDRVRKLDREFLQEVSIVIRATSYADLSDRKLTVLRKNIAGTISKEVGDFRGNNLAEDIGFYEYSVKRR